MQLPQTSQVYLATSFYHRMRVDMESCVPRIRCGLSAGSRVSLPLFLTPAFAPQGTNPVLGRSFSSSPCQSKEKIRHRDKNKMRGMSAIRRTGLRRPVSMSKLRELPKPVLNRRQRGSSSTTPTHGLWGFFSPQREAVVSPDVDLHAKVMAMCQLRVLTVA